MRELQPVSALPCHVARLRAQDPPHHPVTLARVQDGLQVPAAVDARLQLGRVAVRARVDLARPDGDLGRAVGAARVGHLAGAGAELLDGDLAVLDERAAARRLTHRGGSVGTSAG
jgi:hypothetical protein